MKLKSDDLIVCDPKDTGRILFHMWLSGKVVLLDGSRIVQQGWWDAQLKDTFARVLVLKKGVPSIRVMAKSIQGVHLEEAQRKALELYRARNLGRRKF